jgi:hypothetical protein
LGGGLVHKSDEFQAVGEKRPEVVAVVGGKRSAGDDGGGSDKAIGQRTGTAARFVKQATCFRRQLGCDGKHRMEKLQRHRIFFGQERAALEFRPSHRAGVQGVVLPQPCFDFSDHLLITATDIVDEEVGIEVDCGSHRDSTSRVPRRLDPSRNINIPFSQTLAKAARSRDSFFSVGWGGFRLLGFLQRSANDLGLRNLPARGQSFEAMGRDCIEREGGAMSHGWHTIIHTITAFVVKGGNMTR